ncbi:MAG: UbiA family prenyltransferase, partial [candidate division Zixibacteria bacterium]|nr:UbiA family prenyltransferase [candidate division Zixibacteria bacterium]
MLKNLVRLARPAQWLKNLFVLAPLIFAGEARSAHAVEFALLGMAVFCLLSSAVYALNDLVDRKQDRLHPLKKNRPLASGALNAGQAAGMIAFLTVAGLGAAWVLGAQFFVVSIIFLGLNLLYSLLLKNLVILDAMGVALSFVLRAYAGAVVIGVPVSKWLLINTLLLALFLAFGKRRHELVELDSGAIAHRTILIRYSPYILD